MGIIRQWKCLVCGAIIKGENPPEKCPVCGAGADRFVLAKEPEPAFYSASFEKIIVVGNGAAGFTACDEIRKRNPHCRVELISAEPVLTYFRPMLTKGILQQLDAAQLFVKDNEWYKSRSIRLSLGVRAVDLDPVKKQLTLSDGTTRDYDKLILATGAECNRLPMEGVWLEGVYVIRSLEDVNRIRQALGRVERAAVIGGGILGLEAAWELARAGKKVTVFERSERIMKNQLDEKGSALLRKKAEEKGLTIVENAITKGISGETQCQGVMLEDGRLYEAQLVVISAGTKPNTELAEKAGLKTDRFIQVNERMQTSQPDIYACGDAVSCNGVSVGIWNQAVSMGKVAGANAAGDNLTYKPVIPSNSYEGMGTSLFSIGDVGRGAPQSYETRERFLPGKGIYQRLFFQGGLLCGGLLMGDVSATGRLLEAYEKKRSLEEMEGFFEQ